jgi:Flp pilus assembly protein TadD
MSLQKFKSLSGSSVLGIAALVAVLLVGVVAIPPLRSGILSSLDAGREYLLFGAASDSFEFEESAGEGEGGTPKKRGTFRRIVTAPVRLFAGIFRRGGSKDSLAIRPASEKEIDRMKLIPMQRTRSSADLMADIGEPVDTEATVAHRAAQNLFDEAINQHDRGRLDAAIEKLAAATVLAPTFAEAYNMLGVCYDQKRQFQSAQQEYGKALRLDRQNARYLNNLGYSYYLAGDDGEAIKWYRKGLKVTPQDRRLHNNLGMAFGRKGDMPKAREHFMIAVGQTGTHLNLGYIFNQQGQYEEAIRQYQLALQTDAQSVSALGNLAQLYERTGRLREAAQIGEQYRRVVAVNQQKEESTDQE